MSGWKNSVYNNKQIPSSDTSQLGCSNPRQLCLRNRMRIPYWWTSHPCSLDITILQSSRHSAFYSFKSWCYYISFLRIYFWMRHHACPSRHVCCTRSGHALSGADPYAIPLRLWQSVSETNLRELQQHWAKSLGTFWGLDSGGFIGMAMELCHVIND